MWGSITFMELHVPFLLKEKAYVLATGPLNPEVSFRERWVERKGMVFTIAKQVPIFSRRWTIPSPQSVSGKQQVPSVPILFPNALCCANDVWGWVEWGRAHGQLSRVDWVQRQFGSPCKMLCVHCSQAALRMDVLPTSTPPHLHTGRSEALFSEGSRLCWKRKGKQGINSRTSRRTRKIVPPEWS